MKIRAVLDTNVLIAAFRSRSPSSPNQEILDRWEKGEIDLLFSDDVLAEYVEKLQELQIPKELIREVISLLCRLGICVAIDFFHLPRYPEDPDDICFLLCALNGGASHLVTHDRHLLSLSMETDDALVICEAVPFLRDVRDRADFS